MVHELETLSAAYLDDLVKELDDARLHPHNIVHIREHILHGEHPTILGDTIREARGEFDESLDYLISVDPKYAVSESLSRFVRQMGENSRIFVNGMRVFKYFLLNELDLIELQFSGRHKLEAHGLIWDATSDKGANYDYDDTKDLVYRKEAEGQSLPIRLRGLLPSTRDGYDPMVSLVSEVKGLTDLLNVLEAITNKPVFKQAIPAVPSSIQQYNLAIYLITKQVHNIQTHYRRLLGNYGYNLRGSQVLEMLQHIKIPHGKRFAYGFRELRIRTKKKISRHEGEVELGISALQSATEFFTDSIFLGFDKFLGTLARYAMDKYRHHAHSHHDMAMENYKALPKEHRTGFVSIYKKGILADAHAFIRRKWYQLESKAIELFKPPENEVREFYRLLFYNSQAVPRDIRQNIMTYVFRQLMRAYPNNSAIPSICHSMGFLTAHQMHAAAARDLEEKMAGASGEDRERYGLLRQKAEKGELYKDEADFDFKEPSGIQTMLMAFVKRLNIKHPYVYNPLRLLPTYS